MKWKSGSVGISARRATHKVLSPFEVDYSTAGRPLLSRRLSIPFAPILSPLLLSLVLLMQGCASSSIYRNTILSVDDAACVRFFATLAGLVERNSVRDAGTVRVDGFPQLRLDRFHESLTQTTSSPDAFGAWTERLRRLDLAARRFELANLPSESLKTFSLERAPAEPIEQTVDRCGMRLNQRLLTSPQLQAILLKRAQVPDAYQPWKRIAGVYGLTRYAAGLGISRLHRKLGATFQSDPTDLSLNGRLIRYGPPKTTQLATEEVGEILKSADDNPLKIPLPTAGQLGRLFDTFAPFWEIDVVNRNDLIGEVTVDRGGRPWINTAFPRVYRKHAFTRFQGKTLLQLVYQVWLPAREKTGSLDLYGGNLDSVMWRVTLGPDGAPVAYDSIHACGCYYLLFPGNGYRPIPPSDGAEPVLSPKPAPEVPKGSRMTIRLEHGTHYIQQLYVRPNSDADHVYGWMPYGNLRSLEAPDGVRYSLFGEDGIVNESRRTERYLLWPFGIASPGAMRQWGTHAIAFTGRRHFDDPFLLEHLIEPKGAVTSNPESTPRWPLRRRRGRD